MRRAVLTMTILASWLVGACGGGSGKQADAADDAVVDVPDDAAVDATPEVTPPIEGITSATPGVASALLTSAHPGWANGASCLSCHEGAHVGGFGPGDCATCHGPNGAPERTAARHAGGAFACATCHAEAHAGVAYDPPDDCLNCHRWEVPADGCAVTVTTDVVVIGAGGGGLGAAAKLAKGGVDVIVLEQNNRLGGCMGRFQRGDYSFEISLHALDGLNQPDGPNYLLWKDLGAFDKMKPIHLDPMYRMVYPDRTLDIPADFETYRALLKTEFPGDADGIDALFDEMKIMQVTLEAAMKAQEGDTTAIGQIEQQYPGAFTRLLGYMELTLAEFLEGFLHDPDLVGVWAQLAMFAGNQPSKLSALFFMAMWNSYHLYGYYHFEGGSQAIPDALAAVVRENGGTIRTNARAVGIDVVDGKATRVRTADGTCYEADWVVSNANAPDTLLKMVPDGALPAAYVERVKGLQIGLSAYVVYLGVNADLREVFGDSYEINVALDYDLGAAFQAMHDCDATRSGLSITNMSVIDPTAAPAGKNVITLTSQFAFDCGEQWKWGGPYAESVDYKEALARTLLERAEVIVPGLSEHIEVMEVGTPMTIQQYTLNPTGTIFGWDNTVEQAIRNRLEQQTPIPNLLLAGAWTFPGGGQSAVVMSGINAAKVILKTMAEPTP
jgi:prolycopene isomerase